MPKFWKNLRTFGDKLHRRATAGQRQLGFETLETRKLLATLSGDFNGDGFADMAIGVPGYSSGAARGTGAVQVLYGTGSSGLSSTNTQLWNLARTGMAGPAQSGDAFGSVIAVGDFNGDGYTDMAVSAPGRTVAGAVGAGAVSVIYGSANGLQITGNQLWTEISAIPGTLVQANSQFGAALVAGDFNGDGYTDLAISAPFLKVGTVKNAGGVYVLFGSPTGLAHGTTQFLSQGVGSILGTPTTNSEFGQSLAAADFNQDGIADLAVGTPNYVKGAASQAGAVNVIYGTSSGLSSAGNQLWTQGGGVNSLGIMVQGTASIGAQFGWSLTTGDFNADGIPDLAVGAPGAVVGAVKAGSVNVIFGSITGDGLTAKNNELLTRKSFGSTPAAGDAFGYSLAAGNFDGNPGDDLAVGIPLADVNGVVDAGMVAIIHGSTQGLIFTNPTTHLTTVTATLVSQGTNGFGDLAKKGDHFGTSLVVGDYNGDGYMDLSVGSPTESVGSTLNAGVVQTFYGSAIGITSKGQQLWREGLPGLLPLSANNAWGTGIG